MIGEISYLDEPASLYIKKSNFVDYGTISCNTDCMSWGNVSKIDLGNCGDYDYKNHKTTVNVSPNDYIDETIVKSGKRYKIRHHQRMIHR